MERCSACAMLTYALLEQQMENKNLITFESDAITELFIGLLLKLR